jgi:alpha-D-ribose 1-methylphosphonate 5-phosphate C-P lyase
MLGKRKEELDRKEKDLELRIAALVEAQARGLNPRDNHDKRMELIELSGILRDTEVDRIVEFGQLATQVRDVSKVLEDLGMSPIPRIPRDPCTFDDVLGVVDVILEDVKEAYDSGHDP